MVNDGRPLRILHIVGHVSPARRYGGPNSVAIAQATALRSRGHEVTIVAGSEGYELGRTEIDGISAVLFPSVPTVTRSFAHRTAPGLRTWVRRNSQAFDISHVHLARDFVTTRAAAALKAPMVVQPHGMLTRRSLSHAAFDKLVTRRLVARARMVMALNPLELSQLRNDFIGIAACVVTNAVAVKPEVRKDDDPPTILYLARLHERKRPEVFARAAIISRREGLVARYLLIGPDEGEAARIRAMAEANPDVDLHWLGPATSGDVGRAMASAALYVLPARDEPFGLTLLEAVAQGTPVVADTSSPLGRELQNAGVARLFDGSAEDLSATIRSAVDDRALRERAKAHGARIVAAGWGLDRLGENLEQIYGQAVAM
ncbi:glycosyltransferase [Microbacterium terricola]|nr:glycosyltransferase [Microbacterium terricola]UYK39491.1 glycosyltransferase [Microbacterium terricola]